MDAISLRTGTGTVTVEVRRKRVKNFNLRVRADGTVALSMPLHARRADAEAMLQRHRAWIEARLARRATGEKPAAPSLLARTSIPIWGEEAPASFSFEPMRARGRIAREDGILLFKLPGKPSAAQAEHGQEREQVREAEAQRLLDGLYKREVERALPEYAERYERMLGVRASSWSVRRMRTRWGSCTPSTGAVRINAALAAYPPACLSYVVAHELVHLLEPSHNARFHALLEAVLPEAEALRARLKRPA